MTLALSWVSAFSAEGLAYVDLASLPEGGCGYYLRVLHVLRLQPAEGGTA